MFEKLKKLWRKKSSNRTTFVSLLIIIGMFFILKANSPNKDAVPPEIIFYNSSKYSYAETIKDSPLKFVRKNGAGYEGYTLLFRRKNKNDKPPQEVYIYTGKRRYRVYRLTNQ